MTFTKRGNTNGTQVLLYKCDGVQSATKIEYRCRHCDIVYKYDVFGSWRSGYQFYRSEQLYVKSTDTRYVERLLINHWQQLRLHAQISFDSAALSYNSAFKDMS